MAFDWNFRRQPNLNNYIGSQVDPYNASRIATENMQGYTPNAAFTPGTPAQQAAAAMQGYNPNPQGGQFGVPNDMHGGMAQPDLEGYGESLQAAEQAAAQKQEREQTIQKLTSQIAELEQRITANKAKLKDWGGVESQIAAIEARKINKQDPTSVWRWKQDKDTLQKNRIDDQKRIEAQKALNEAKEKVINRYKLDATLKSAKADPYMTRDQKKAMLMTLNDAMRDAQIHNDTEYMDKVQGALDELNNASSYEDLENGLKENYLRIKGMIGKKGGHTKDQAVEMINEMLADGTYDPVFKNNPGLKEQLLNFTISNTPNKPAPGWNSLLQSGN